MRYVAQLVVAICCVFVLLHSGSARAERKVALIIGNNLYGHHAALPNVPNDAAAMAALLKGAGFDKVDVHKNLGSAAVRGALRDFAGEVATADVAVLFYAGHGIEVGGTNYLIPVDARLATDYDVKDETVELDRVLEAMAPAKRLRLVILDACRGNPFVKGMTRTGAGRDVGRGLGRFEPPVGNTLIAFATKPNAIALDGKGPNSPFTAALVKHLATPGLDLRLALGYVRDDVLASTGGKQEPYQTGSLGGGTFAIVGGAPKPAPTSPPGQQSEVERTWDRVKDTTSIAALEAFHQRYRKENPVYARLAEARIGDLKKQQVAMASPPAPPKPPVVAFDPSRAPVPLTAVEERSLKAADHFKECSGCPEMVVVPAGEFIMGSQPDEAGLRSNEGPQRKVRIARPFAVGKYEVTFTEWDACVAERGCSHTPADEGWGRGKRPVMNVSWNDITQQYLPWLSRKTGKTYRLLTEAEWEYVTRADTTAPFWWGSSISPSQANYNGNYTYGGGPEGEYRHRTVPVNSFAPNPWGLYNVHGNVSEWVQDCWHDSYDGAPADGRAWEAGSCTNRIFRGGSWLYGPVALRSSYRFSYGPSTRWHSVGFRVARTL